MLLGFDLISVSGTVQYVLVHVLGQRKTVHRVKKRETEEKNGVSLISTASVKASFCVVVGQCVNTLSRRKVAKSVSQWWTGELDSPSQRSLVSCL